MSGEKEPALGAEYLYGKRSEKKSDSNELLRKGYQ